MVASYSVAYTYIKDWSRRINDVVTCSQRVVNRPCVSESLQTSVIAFADAIKPKTRKFRT